MKRWPWLARLFGDRRRVVRTPPMENPLPALRNHLEHAEQRERNLRLEIERIGRELNR
jgi:hypothetical protein